MASRSFPGQQRRPQLPGEAAESRRLVDGPVTAGFIGARRDRQQLAQRELSAEREHVLARSILLLARISRGPLAAGTFDGDRPIHTAVTRARIRRSGEAGQRQRLAHAPLAQVEDRGELRESRLQALVAAASERRDPNHCRIVGVVVPPADRDRLVGDLRLRSRQREQTDPGGDPMSRAQPRVGCAQQDAIADSGDGAGQARAVPEQHVGLDRHGCGPHVGGDAGRPDDRDHLVADGHQHGPAELPGRQRATSDLGLDDVDRVAAREHAFQQPLSDPPQLEAIELDRQLVANLVVVVDNRDPEALAHERSHRALDERDQVGERHRLLFQRRQRLAQERLGRAPRADERAGALERDRIKAPRPAGREPTRRRSWPGRTVAAGGGRVPAHAALGSAVPGVGERAVASIASSSSPTGTAGGRGAFVRSSLPCR
jgi:hypothetical protein